MTIMKLPIKSKLMFWSSILFFFLIVITNLTQYIIINHWVIKREQQVLQDKLVAVAGYLLQENNDISLDEIQDSRPFLASLIDKNQMIRILDASERPLMVIENEVKNDWVVPHSVSSINFSQQWHEKDQLLIARSPLAARNFSGTVEIVSNIEAVNKILQFILLVMVSGGVGGIVLGCFGGAFVSHQLLKPINALADTMRKVQAKGLKERVAVPETKDELADLAQMFNAMMTQLEASFQQQKQFVEDASHELRTPIAIVEGHLALLNRWGKNDPAVLQESLAAAIQETKRLRVLANELLELSRADAYFYEEKIDPINPAPVIRHAVQSMARINDKFKFTMDLAQIENVKVVISADRLKQVLLILLDNAIKYSPECRCINVKGAYAGTNVYISVIDRGIGIPEDDLARIFDRFYRVDKARGGKQRGTGLGLAIARRLVRNYHGDIAAESKAGKGTTFTVILPAGQA